MLLYLNTLSWLRVNQFLLFILKVVWLVEKQQMPFLVFGFTDRGFEHTLWF